jgi:hypothetical protein
MNKKKFSYELKHKYNYKYSPFDDGAKLLLENATMKFTNHTDFNDPFDCIPTISQGTLDKESTNKDTLNSFAEARGLSQVERVSQKKELQETIKKTLSSKAFIDTSFEKLGICCLTVSPCNILMWSHYAKNHTGLVFEFQNEKPLTPTDFCSDLIGYEVLYEVNRPSISLEGDEDFRKALLTKSKAWEYENEIRVIDLERGPGIYPFNPNILKSVILGLNFDSNSYSDIKKLVLEYNEKFDANVSLYQVKMHKTQYKLSIPEHDVFGEYA